MGSRRNTQAGEYDSRHYEKLIDELSNENDHVKQKLAECIEELKHVAKEKMTYEAEIEKLKKIAVPDVEKGSINFDRDVINYQKDDIANILLEAQRIAKGIIFKANMEANY